MSVAVQLEPEPPAPEPDNMIVLKGATWADYQRMLELRGDHSVPRLAFLEGQLQIMSPSRGHEGVKGRIGCLVEVFCLERGIEFETLGSWTLEDKSVERGAEPDECYVFGGRADDGRPDLAIEVDWSRSGLDKLRLYSMLRVPELWIWRRGAITVHLREGGAYREGASAFLPGLDLAQLTSFLDRPTTSQAMKEYRAALQGG
jgi:Uma2 family endonuclease